MRSSSGGPQSASLEAEAEGGGGGGGGSSSTTAVSDRKRGRNDTNDGGSSPASSRDGSSHRDQQYHQHAQTQSQLDAACKKRRSGPGSRGVANLTPEQLEKKRANDREAQRAIRERTKAQIESLQRQIHDLMTQQPQLELQAALRAKEAVEAELVDIKRRLASVLSMIQPILASGTDQQPPMYPSPSQTYLPVVQQHQQQQQPGAPSSIHNASTPTSTASPTSGPPPGQQHWHGELQLPTGPSPPLETPYPQAKLLHQQRQELVHGLDLGVERLGLDFLLDPTHRVSRIQNGINGAQDSPHYRHVPMKHDLTGTMQQEPQPFSHHNPGFALAARLDYGVGSPSFQGQGGPGVGPTENFAGFSAPVKNGPPTCPLDNLLLDFLHERRQRAAEGIPAQEVIGPRYPSVSSLLNPANSRFSHPVSKVFTDILQTFPDISALPERVAVLYIMFLIMRWQISPTQENYDRLPEWATPRPSQLFTAHPAWMDHLPFPRMRERLVRDYGSKPENFPFENFFIPFTTTLSLNWPYEEIDTLLQNPDSDELMINPVFERHLRRLENWTLGDAFAKAFPGLADTYNLKSGSAEAINLVR